MRDSNNEYLMMIWSDGVRGTQYRDTEGRKMRGQRDYMVRTVKGRQVEGVREGVGSKGKK